MNHDIVGPHDAPPVNPSHLPDPAATIRNCVTSLDFSDYLARHVRCDIASAIPYDEYWRAVAEFSGGRVREAFHENRNPKQAAVEWVTAAAPYYYEAYQQLNGYREPGIIPKEELLDFTVRYQQFLGMTLGHLPDITAVEVVNHLVATIAEVKGLQVAASPFYIERDMGSLVDDVRHKIAYKQIARAIRSYMFEQGTLDDVRFGVDFWVKPVAHMSDTPWLGLSVVSSLEEYRRRNGVPGSVVHEDATSLVTSDGVAIVESLVEDTKFQGKCRLDNRAVEELAPWLALQVGQVVFRNVPH